MGRDLQIGDVLRKRKSGSVVAEAHVVEGGIEFGGKVYKTISAAAKAAAASIGMASASVNGWAFFAEITHAGDAPIEQPPRKQSLHQKVVEASSEAAVAEVQASFAASFPELQKYVAHAKGSVSAQAAALGLAVGDFVQHQDGRIGQIDSLVHAGSLYVYVKLPGSRSYYGWHPSLVKKVAAPAGEE